LEAVRDFANDDNYHYHDFVNYEFNKFNMLDDEYDVYSVMWRLICQ
jgi:hypothetical protein